MRGHKDTHRRRSYDDGGRDWSDAVINQDCQKAPELGRDKEWSFSKGNTSLPTPSF
jgi:hypothetical protein